jgi:hypothetical protein
MHDAATCWHLVLSKVCMHAVMKLQEPLLSSTV